MNSTAKNNISIGIVSANRKIYEKLAASSSSVAPHRKPSHKSSSTPQTPTTPPTKKKRSVFIKMQPSQEEYDQMSNDERIDSLITLMEKPVICVDPATPTTLLRSKRQNDDGDLEDMRKYNERIDSLLSLLDEPI